LTAFTIVICWYLLRPSYTEVHIITAESQMPKISVFEKCQ